MINMRTSCGYCYPSRRYDLIFSGKKTERANYKQVDATVSQTPTHLTHNPIQS